MLRHLLGIESPPADHVADPSTLGPVLPEGWDGDAWIAAKGDHFFSQGMEQIEQPGRVCSGRYV